MTELSTAPEAPELKKTARKYGIAAAVMFANSQILAYIFMVIAGVAAALLPNGDVIMDAGTDQGFTFLMILNAVISYTVPILAYTALFRQELDSSFSKAAYRRFPCDNLILFLCGSFVATSASMLTSYISGLLKSLAGIPEPTEAFSGSKPQDIYQYIVFIIFVCVVAPLLEEIIYRYLLLKPLRRYGDSAAVLITSLLFALSHFNFTQFLYTFCFGMFLAAMAIRSDWLMPSIVFHVINNLLATLSSYAPNTLGSDAADAFMLQVSGVLATVSVAMYIIAIPLLLAVLFKRVLTLQNNCGIPQGRQMITLLTDPVMLISIILSLTITFVNLF